MKYEKNPIVEEIRKTRKKLFEQCHSDPHEYGKLIRKVGEQRRKAGKKKHRHAA